MNRDDLISITQAMRLRANPLRYTYVRRAIQERNVYVLIDHGTPGFLLDSLRFRAKSHIRNHPLLKHFPESLTLAFTLLSRSLRCKDVVFVTFGNSLSSYILMALQLLLSPIRKPRIHVLFDCLWEGGHSLRRSLVVKIRRLLVNRVIYKCVVYGLHDFSAFPTLLGIRHDKLHFIPYHHTLADASLTTNEGDYIFAGGYHGRDYVPLINASKALELPLRIATNDQTAFSLAKTSGHICVKETTPQEFVEWMASSRFVVIPYGRTSARTGGHQSFINAMLMGKAVVISNPDIAKGYITHGENGIVVDHRDSAAFHDILYKLYHSPEFRQRIAQAGRNWVLQNNLCPEEWVLRVYDLALEGHYRLSASSGRTSNPK